MDKNGIEHEVTLDSNNCDSKRPVWQTDTGSINEKDLLPIQGNLLKGIDNCSCRAHKTVRLINLEARFSDNFYNFQLLQTTLAIYGFHSENNFRYNLI